MLRLPHLVGRPGAASLVLLIALGCTAPIPQPPAPLDQAPPSDSVEGSGEPPVPQAPVTLDAADEEPAPTPLVGLSGAPLPIGIDARTQELLAALRVRYEENLNVRFQLIETVDRLDEHGRKLQSTHLRSGSSARPDRLTMTVDGDLQQLDFWRAGGVVTVLDRAQNTWRSVPDDGSQGLVAELLSIDGVPLLPFRFFLEGNPADALIKDVISGEYLGVRKVGEVPCDHIILSTPTHDRQLWIEAEGRHRAVKLVETFRDLPGQPQYELHLEISTTVDSLPDSLFVFEPPEGAVQIVDDTSTDTDASTDTGEG